MKIKKRGEELEISILGTNYELIMGGTTEDYPDLADGNDGYCNYQLKQIVISKEYDDGTKSYEKYLETVVRHEIIHAYLYESGLHDYANDERIVDWVAIQFPKMKEAFSELKVI